MDIIFTYKNQITMGKIQGRYKLSPSVPSSCIFLSCCFLCPELWFLFNPVPLIVWSLHEKEKSGERLNPLISCATTTHGEEEFTDRAVISNDLFIHHSPHIKCVEDFGACETVYLKGKVRKRTQVFPLIRQLFGWSFFPPSTKCMMDVSSEWATI